MIEERSPVAPIPDPTGFQITPTLHTSPSTTIDPSKTTLKLPYVVCVLGASRGIGASIAKAYALAGASTIIMAARSLPALETAAAEARAVSSSATLMTVICDVASAESVSSLAERIKTELGRLDTVVVNAAYYGPMVTSVVAGEPQDFRRVVETNILGAYNAAHFLLPLLVDTEGGAKGFIAISSLGAWMIGGEVAHTAACMSKLGQFRLIEMVAEEFRDVGVLAVAIHPGFVITEMSDVVDEKWRKSKPQSDERPSLHCISLG